VREVMIPRHRAVFVTTDETFDDVVHTIRDSGLTRLPLCRPDGGLDAAIGLLHVKDMLIAEDRDDLEALARPLERVPEAMLIDELLERLRRLREHFGLVVDEHGTAVGLITLEDVLEEIVGEISDEHDPLDHGARRRDDTWSLSGLLRPDEVAERTGVRLPEHEHYDTLAGLFLLAHGRMPVVGDSVDVPLPVVLDADGDAVEQRVAVLTVERMVGLRIERILMATRPATPKGS
jgi:CBS domain containing-hemolysin-like protein